MEITCHVSYPLNSENARPFGTFRLYLSCVEPAPLPKTANTNAMIAITRGRILFMAYPSVALWKFEFRSHWGVDKLSGRIVSQANAVVKVRYKPRSASAFSGVALTVFDARLYIRVGRVDEYVALRRWWPFSVSALH